MSPVLPCSRPPPPSQPGNNATKWKRLLNRVDELGLPYMTKGRNQFESILIATPDKTAIVQPLVVNSVRRFVAENFDMPLPGCNQGLPKKILRYHNKVVKGISDDQHAQLRARMQTVPKMAPWVTEAHLAPLSGRFNLCAPPSAKFRAYFDGKFACAPFRNRTLCAPARGSEGQMATKTGGGFG